MGAARKEKIASSIQPIGLPGRRAATSVPTAAADTMGTAVTSQSITGPPGPVWWVKPSIGTLERPITRCWHLPPPAHRRPPGPTIETPRTLRRVRGVLDVLRHHTSSRDRTRTYNLPVNSRTLCRLSYAGSAAISGASLGSRPALAAGIRVAHPGRWLCGRSPRWARAPGLRDLIRQRVTWNTARQQGKVKFCAAFPCAVTLPREGARCGTGLRFSLGSPWAL